MNPLDITKVMSLHREIKQHESQIEQARKDIDDLMRPYALENIQRAQEDYPYKIHLLPDQCKTYDFNLHDVMVEFQQIRGTLYTSLDILLKEM